MKRLTILVVICLTVGAIVAVAEALPAPEFSLQSISIPARAGGAYVHTLVVAVEYSLPRGFYQQDTSQFVHLELEGPATVEIRPLGPTVYPTHTTEKGWVGSFVLTRTFEITTSSRAVSNCVVHAAYQLCDSSNGLCAMPRAVVIDL